MSYFEMAANVNFFFFLSQKNVGRILSDNVLHHMYHVIHSAVLEDTKHFSTKPLLR